MIIEPLVSMLNKDKYIHIYLILYNTLFNISAFDYMKIKGEKNIKT